MTTAISMPDLQKVDVLYPNLSTILIATAEQMVNSTRSAVLDGLMNAGSTLTKRAAAGSGSTETATYTFDGSSLPYFKVEFLVNDLESDLAELVFTLAKCQVTGGTIMSGSTDSFGSPSFDAEAILPTATGVGFGTVQFRESASGLSA